MSGSRDRDPPPDSDDAWADEAPDPSTVLGFHLMALPGIEDLIPESSRDPQVTAAVDRLIEEAGHLRAALARAYQRIAALENIADRDSLVPVLNRRAFMRELSRAIAFGERYGTPASVIFLDVNGMKQINDTFGHGAGDAVLNAVAELLAEHVRQSDVVGRLGGDEFGIILMQAGGEAAKRKGAALSRVIAATPLAWEHSTIRLTAAHGVHTLRDDDTPLSALRAADQAMYREKARLQAAANGNRRAD